MLAPTPSVLFEEVGECWFKKVWVDGFGMAGVSSVRMSNGLERLAKENLGLFEPTRSSIGSVQEGCGLGTSPSRRTVRTHGVMKGQAWLVLLLWLGSQIELRCGHEQVYIIGVPLETIS